MAGGKLFYCRADNAEDAYIQLDEFGIGPAEMWELGSCAMDFKLTDAGTFRLAQFGSEMRDELLDSAYPLLNQALTSELLDDHNVEDEIDLAGYDPAATELLAQAVQAERERLAHGKEEPASTERGKDIQRQISGSGRYVDALVRRTSWSVY